MKNLHSTELREGCMKAILAVLAVLAMLAAPALTARAQDQELVGISFELTIDGDVPQGETFEVVVGRQGSDDLSVDVFCGEGVQNLGRPAVAPDCAGGTTYSTPGPVPFTAGETVWYVFRRQGADGVIEDFRNGVVELDEGTTVRVTYDFGNPVAPRLPDTGAGATVGVASPVAPMAAVLPVVAAGLYMLRRRR